MSAPVVHRAPGADEPEGARPPRRRRRWRVSAGPLLAAPGIAWLLAFLVAPLYVVLAVVFGAVDPVFRTAVPLWNPAWWDVGQVAFVVRNLVGPQAALAPALLRTVLYVVVASCLCLLVAFPVAYYTARLAGRWRGLVLTLLIAPFWVSYMMRMLAWVNLLSPSGVVDSVLSLGGLLPLRVDWLSGQPAVVVLGLVYGYLPYMIIPLYAGLDRLPEPLLEAARDLGASRAQAFWRVTVPMTRPVVVSAVMLTCLPMLGDYFTGDLLSGSPSTAMLGNVINDAVLTPGQTGIGGTLVLLVLLVSVLPMLYYVRSVRREQR